MVINKGQSVYIGADKDKNTISLGLNYEMQSSAEILRACQGRYTFVEEGKRLQGLISSARRVQQREEKRRTAMKRSAQWTSEMQDDYEVVIRDAINTKCEAAGAVPFTRARVTDCNFEYGNSQLWRLKATPFSLIVTDCKAGPLDGLELRCYM